MPLIWMRPQEEGSRRHEDMDMDIETKARRTHAWRLKSSAEARTADVL
eukprot:CAMPEP_0179140692 /NCGR_PEP_ID=MMETSP0796-20121207/67398_1 /TAXON_ID=73915 /ORGANISM="Pyrodinium bahamense, Strain pbaha01" /LENGTH=47 /DNA_ID= /DNA_START= /DNA_END= /DNA_ORIENTATION=